MSDHAWALSQISLFLSRIHCPDHLFQVRDFQDHLVADDSPVDVTCLDLSLVLFPTQGHTFVQVMLLTIPGG